MADYQVIVSNVGTVYSGSEYTVARKDYAESVTLSKKGYGRFAGESVTWLRDDNIIREHIGELDNG